MPEGSTPARNESTRAARFARFLRQAVAVKTKPVVEVQKYPTVVWFSALPKNLREVRSPLITPDWPTDDPRWLRVARVQEPVHPVPPDVCRPWLHEVDLDTPSTPPALNPTYEDRDETGQPVQVPVAAEAAVEWGRYVTTVWADWAAKAAVARAVNPLYNTLFSVHQQLQGRADNFDVFVGAGLLDSRIDPLQPVRRHLLAFPAELVLDDRTGTLSLGPSLDFTALRVESEFLTTSERARLQPRVDALHTDLAALGAGLHDRARVGDVLTRLITPLHAVSRYEDALEPVPAGTGGLRVSFAPAFIFRLRSTRSLDALLERIEKDAIDDAAPEELPAPWRKMMEDEAAWQGGDQNGSAVRGARSERVYFPLPSNEEQSRIVRFATGSPGVVVQGPPGTGKSHTIANLIAHFLASGRRVLVTAQTAQALEVLRDKLPADLQPLCVTLLGDSRASDRDLRRSVGGILHRRQAFDAASYRREIACREEELTRTETRVNDLERLIHQARAGETECVEPVPGYSGTRAAIARRLRNESSRFEWFADAIPHDVQCPAYQHGWRKLAEYHAALDEEARKQLAKPCPALPFTREAAIGVLTRIANAKALLAGGARGGGHLLVPETATAETLETAARWVTRLQSVEDTIPADSREWVAAFRRVLLRNVGAWSAVLDQAKSALSHLRDEVVDRIVKVELTGCTQAEARRDLARLQAHYDAGGKRRSLGVLKPRVVKDTEWIEASIRVEGLPVREPEDVARARLALDAQARLDAAWAPWAQWPSSRGGTPRTQAAVLRLRSELLQTLLQTGADAAAVVCDVRRWLADRLEEGVSTADLLAAIGHRSAELALAAARARRDELLEQLRQVIRKQDVVPALTQVLEALAMEDIGRAADAFDASSDELARRAAHGAYAKFIEQLRTFAASVANAMIAAEGTDGWRERLADFEGAWAHARAKNWLSVVLSAEAIEATHRAVRDERQRQQDALAKLTSAKAWYESLRRIDDLKRATLTAWTSAVSRIPATGPNVFVRRGQAQRLLGGCLETIPAWVVSLGRLYETVEPKPGLFDVAIVDEASQCWLDSLVLFYLAKQIIIVGDDKQISPTIVGVDARTIDALAEAFLPDFRFRSNFSLESSLFDHGRRYLSAGVPLREHFRCVPEIIGFSNELSYLESPLIPLRQVSRDRLPPLRRTYVPNGMRTGDINMIEAEAVVEAVARCHTDPAYEEAEFGVICLQGDMQGARIEQLLLERVGHEVFSERRLRCGNPYAFQGDERDVIFLSMVAAPNARQQSLTTAMYEQRFNVAMSRARDQAWLFHSIQEDELGANCLRRKVIEYFRRPPNQGIIGVPLAIPELQQRASRAVRGTERPPSPFESWFEVDVALALAARGYLLAAQVEVAHKRIDLVVEGNNGVRLAVECDGEFWHGADQHEADLNRQRQLERAGWTFVRVRESLFYSDEARAITEVVDACEELEIHPGDGRPPLEREEGEGPSRPVEERPARDEGFRAAAEPGLYQDLASADGAGPSGAKQDETADRDALTGPEWSYTPSALAEPADEGGESSKPFSDRECPDPRTAPATNVREAVLDIVASDGPLTKASIYRFYRDACPRVERAGKQFRHAVNSALTALERARRVEWRDEGRRRLPEEVVFRSPDQPWIRARPAGRRTLDEVPLSELALALLSVAGGLRPQDESAFGEVLRQVARQYGVLRLREQARARLQTAAGIAFDPSKAPQLTQLTPTVDRERS